MGKAHEFVRILGPKRFDSPTSNPGTYRTYRLPPRGGAADAQRLGYFVRVDASSGSNAMVRVGADHGPAGETAVTLDSDIAGSTSLSSTPVMLAGYVAGTDLVGPFVHPFVEVGTVDGNAQWASVEVWEQRKSFVQRAGTYLHRRLAQPMRLLGGTFGNGTGYALEPCIHGQDIQRVVISAKVHEASSGSQLGIRIEHSADGDLWTTHTSESLTTITSEPELITAEFDADSPVGPFYRAVLFTRNNSSDTLLVEVFETANPL